jgi:DNA-binding beta-propeller fold protein YncE
VIAVVGCRWPSVFEDVAQANSVGLTGGPEHPPRPESTMRSRGTAPTSRAVLALALACAALATAGATPALALQGHAFGQVFSSAGSGPGQVKEPAGVAVNEASGDLYVVDEANNRVEVFSGSGKPLNELKGPFTTATGTGSLESGSTKIEALSTTSGAFNVGQEISGSGLPAGTTVTALEPGRLEVSQAATETKAAVALTAQQSFSNPNTIAVDNACAQQNPKLSGSACAAFDPSNGDVYVQDGFSHKVVDKFNASGAFLGQVLVPKGKGALSLQILGVAVDPEGELWISEIQTSPHRGFDRFSNREPNELKENFIQVVPSLDLGLAVDAQDNLYSTIAFPELKETIAKFNDKGALLNEALVEETSSGVATELPSNNVYVDNETSVRRFDADEPPKEVERFGQGHLSAGSGIAVNSTTGQVYVADKRANDIAEFPLEPPGPPTVEGESIAGVTASSATFQAEVNPRGAATEYRFEYGPCASEGTCATSPFEKSTPIPDGPVGADFEVHEVATHPQDLSPATSYHFRVVAHNGLHEVGASEEVVGEEKVFSTQPEGVFGLPDGRGWELVSPAQKHGTRILPILEGTLIQAAAAGNAIAYVTESPTESEPQGYTNFVQVLSSRGQSAWNSKDLTLPHEKGTGLSIGQGNEYRFFTEDLSMGVMQPFGSFIALSPQTSEQTPYLRTNYVNSDPTELCTSDCLQPLVSAANVPEGVQFGEEGKCPPNPLCGPRFVGASADASHVVLTSPVGLTAYPHDEGGLYEWSAGELQLVSILPNGAPASPVIANGRAVQVLGYQDKVARHAISPDGSRVVWSTESGHLYLRDLAKEETVELDRALSGQPKFQTADAQTTKIFFTEGGDLYLYDTQTAQRTQLTSAAGVQGEVAGSSEDGSYLYFVANGQMGEGAVNEGAVEGTCHEDTSSARNACNLYELHESSGTWQPKLVAVLSGEDFPDFRETLPDLTARVSPNGRYLAFMSEQSLTGYDNRDAHSAKRDEEVFRYDASTGGLACASCDPTGARPEGIEVKKLQGGVAAGSGAWHTTQWLAANIPGWTPYALSPALHQSRYLDDSGRLFFNSSDALSPQDVNATEDVYEFEPPGVGGCTTALPTYAPRAGGCIGLISAGTSREESGFLDAGESGADVFFLTSAKLSSADFDTALDVYDAHECSVVLPCIASPAPTPPACQTEASCKAPPTPQPEIFGAPASATFSGAGNLAPPLPAAKPKPPSKAQLLTKALSSCRAKYKHSKKRRKACEAQAHKRYGAKKATAKKKHGK